MDIEQLKLVLDLVKGIADDATSVAIWYIVLSHGLHFLGHLVLWGGIITAVYTIANAFKSSNDDSAFVLELRDKFVPEGYGWVDSKDRRKIRQALEDLYVKSNDTKATKQ